MPADRLTFEELQRRLLEKEAQIIELQMTIEALKGWTDVAHIQELETDLNPLPVPRLELRGSPVDDAIEWRYCLVYKHFLGHIEFVTLSLTRVSGAGELGSMEVGNLRLPMRDGAHIHHDMKELKLPGFAILGETIDELESHS